MRQDSLERVTRKLVHEFRELDPRTVAREVARAMGAVKWIGLVEDELLIVELVARAQLEFQSGRRDEAARLDPQRHPGRARLAPAIV